ncbi:MAG: hypothetical protein ABIA12_00760 [Candidatus Aenigmatarchaeota archaeon]
MSKGLDRSLGKNFVPLFFDNMIGNDTEYLNTFLTPEDKAKLGSVPDSKSLLTMCYQRDALGTLRFLVDKTDIYLKEAAEWYKAMLYIYGMTEKDPQKAKDCYEKLVGLEEKYGKLIEAPISDVVTSLPEPPSIREQLKARVEELQQPSG